MRKVILLFCVLLVLLINVCSLANQNSSNLKANLPKEETVSYMNLLMNSDFEMGFESWTHSSDWTVTRDGIGNSKSALCQIQRGENPYLEQNINLNYGIAGKTFMGSVMMRAEHSTKIMVNISWKDAKGNVVLDINELKLLPNSHQWQTVKIEGVAPLGSTQVSLMVQPVKMDGHRRIWVDHCFLGEKTKPNLLNNPSFEEDFSKWLPASCWEVETQQVMDGSKAAHCIVPSGNSAELKQTVNMKKDISGITFTATGWIKTLNITNASIMLKWKNMNNEWLTQNIGKVGLSGTKQWSPISVTGVAPLTATQIVIVVSPVTDGVGEIWVDKFIVKEEPTPNLLKNPGFEEDYRPWSLTGNWRMQNQASIGKRCISTIVTPDQDASLSQGCDYSRDISGLRFFASTKVKAAVKQKLMLKISWKDRNNKLITGAEKSVTMDVHSKWVELKVDGVAPAGATQVWFTVSTYASRRVGTVSVDECSLRPASILSFDSQLDHLMNTVKFRPMFGLPQNIETFTWDMNNDGLIDSYLEKPCFTFASPGDYLTSLKVLSEDGAEYLVTQNVNVPSPFLIKVTWSELNGFILTPTTNSEASFASAFWDFGDGHTLESSSLQVAHAYSDGGQYLVQVNARDSFGNQINDSLKITVPSSVEATASVNSVVEDGLLKAQCSVSPTVHYGGSITSVIWNFGDGSTSPGTVVNHLYSTPGIYEPKVTIIDSFGYSHLFSAGTVEIGAIPEPEISLSEGEICHGMVNIRGSIGYSGKIDSIGVFVDEVNQTSTEGNYIDWSWDSFLWANGSHQIEVRVVLAGGQKLSINRSVIVMNPIYQVRLIPTN